MPESQTPRTPRRVPRAVRWLAWIAGALVVVLLLLALGLAVFTNRFLRPVVEEQASNTIPGKVEIGGLGISLLTLGVTLDQLTVRPPEGDAKPVLEVGRLHVSLAWLPLLAGRIVVDDAEIDAPVVRVVRLPTGELDLLKVLTPESEEPPVAEAAPSEPLPIRIDVFELGKGRVEFTDQAQAGAEPLVIELPAARIVDVTVTGDPGEDPSVVHLEVSAEGAKVAVDGNVRRDGDRIDVDAIVEVSNLSLARPRVYLPDLGWRRLGGELDARIHYVHKTGETQKVDGRVGVRALTTHVPSLEEPALSISSLDIEITELDLLARRIALGQVTLKEAKLLFDPVNPFRLPMLPKGLPPSEPPPADALPPFAWSLAGLEIDDAALVPLGEGQQPLTLRATLEDLRSTSEAPSVVKLELAQGDGSLAIDGKLQVAPAGFAGKLALEKLALAPLVHAFAGKQQQGLVQGGVANAKLELRLGTLFAGDAPAPGGDLRVVGNLSVDGLDAKSDAEGSLRAQVAKIELDLGKIELPGLLPPPGTAAPPPPAAPGVSAPPPATNAPPAAAPDAAPAPAPGAPAPPGADAPPAPAAEAPTTPAPASPPAPAIAASALRWESPADAGTIRVAGTLAVSGVSVKSGKGEPLAFDMKSLNRGVTELELSRLLAAPVDGKPPPDAGSLRFAGALALEAIALRSGKDGEFGFELEKGEIGVKEVAAPGLLPTDAARAKPEPVRIALVRVRLATPRLRITRSDGGILLPFLPASAPAATPAVDASADTSADATQPAPAAASTTPAAPSPFQLELASFHLDNGNVRFVDRTVKPFYQGEVAGLTVSVRDVVYPGPRGQDLSVKFQAPGPANAWMLGGISPTSTWFEFGVEKLPLAPLNPYVRNATGYIVNGGDVTIYSKGSNVSGHLYAANWISLDSPDLSGGGPESPLEKAVGVPISLAIALLKDASGKIGLSIPIDFDRTGAANVRLRSVIGSAVTSVMIGALTSPLKLLGAVVDAGGKVKDVTPQSIRFLPGRAELATGAEEQVAALAQIAATRPGLGIRLRGQTSGTDGQFLREATLLEAIDTGDGLPEPAKGLTQALVRRRLGAALKARLEGKPEELDPEDAKTLDEWLSGVAIEENARGALAGARSTKVWEMLKAQFGLEGDQVKVAEPGPPGGSPEPAVDIQLGS